MTDSALPRLALPEAIRPRYIPHVNGLTMHVLEAGFEAPERPCVLLLHGFPELAFSWRRIMPSLAAAGYHVIAPDQRGYGRTSGWTPGFDVDLTPFSFPALVDDVVQLLRALGRDVVDCVVGHDFGSPVAAWCALMRPDLFRSVALMSAPFGGPPARDSGSALFDALDAALASLPRPRRHYMSYYSLPEAEANMSRCPQGLHAFLRAYVHAKSGDASGPDPEPAREATIEAFARLPDYYVMDRTKGMAETVAETMPTREEIARCAWLPETELALFADEFGRTGFQGGLNWYRCVTQGVGLREMARYAGRSIEVPAIFVAGRRDWGVHQTPGAFEAMQRSGCSRLSDCVLLDGAGHWVQQEQPEAVSGLLLRFLDSIDRT